MFWKKYKYDDIKSVEFNELKKRIKIVVIDDEEDSFPIKHMQSLGFTIEYWKEIDINNIKRLEDGNFDLIILDIYGVVNPQLGQDLTGLDILKSLKHRNPKQLIIAFSGSSYEIDKGEFWKLADDFLKKPSTTFETKERLENIINQNYSINTLINNLKMVISRQIQDSNKESDIEKIISKAIITKNGNIDFVKLVRLGVQDTAAITTIVTTIINIMKE
ncbi:MAG: hypothetical protein ACNI3C_05905 [Candidatus Marinarcus sp.]|uniref:hypothetical protein n=1 Tax=Candidatus Marinarcus sp. TaxID=3100987 RepID=UPI003B00278A